MTLLHLACYNGFVKLTQILLDEGAEVGTEDATGRIPLHIAVANDRVQITKLLLDRAKDPNVVTRFSETSLHLASRLDDTWMFNMLLDYGRDYLGLDAYGRSWFDWAVEWPPLIDAKNIAKQYQITPESTSRLTLRSTIRTLSITDELQNNVNRLSHCLLLIGDEEYACRGFEYTIDPQSHLYKGSIYCDRCGIKIRQYRHICKSCVDCDLCEACYVIFRGDQRSWRCQSHEFLKVTLEESLQRNLTCDERNKDANAWLREIREKYRSDLDSPQLMT